MMYKILGADKNEYGPVSAEQIAHWVAEARANAETMVQAEGSTEWRPLSSFPELAGVLHGATAPGTPPPFPAAPGVAQQPTADRLMARDYNLSIGDCISRGWNLVTQNFGLLFVASLVFCLIQIGLTVLGAIPLVGLIFSLASLVIDGPLLAGLYSVFLAAKRGQPTSVGGVFSGFSNRFGQYLLAYLVPACLTSLAALPGAILLGAGIALAKNHPAAGIPLLAIGAIVLLVPVLYFSISWGFTVPLTLDKNLDFWPSMGVSRKVVGKHFFSVLGLMFVLGLINIVGVALCLVGVLFTLALTFATMAVAFDVLFTAETEQVQPLTPKPYV